MSGVRDRPYATLLCSTKVAGKSDDGNATRVGGYPEDMVSVTQRHKAEVETAVTALASALHVPVPPSSATQLCRLVRDADAHGVVVSRAQRALAVRAAAQALEARRPGGTVELRIPPYAAVQLGLGEDVTPSGAPRHRRGTPPTVVETDAATFADLIIGTVTWADALSTHRIQASGAHADLADLFPLP